MARPLRFEFPGAFYHVMNRGANHNPIFLQPEADRDLFYRCLQASVNRFKIKIHSFSLMNNHYHLLIETPCANLSRAMRHIDGVYTQQFNRRHGRDGPLLRGRFKSKLVQKEKYFLELIRYIHLNGVKAGLYAHPLHDPFCSHRNYLGLVKPPPWLSTDLGLSYFRRTPQDPAIELDQFVNAGVPSKLSTLLDKRKWPAILGEDIFIKTIRERFIDDKEKDKDQPQKNELVQWKPPSSEEIMAWIGQRHRCSKEFLTKKASRKNKELKTLTILLLHQMGFKTYEEIGKIMGNLSYAAISKICNQNNEIYGAYEEELKKIEKEFWHKK